MNKIRHQLGHRRIIRLFSVKISCFAAQTAQEQFCLWVPLGGAGVEGGAWPVDGRVVLRYRWSLSRSNFLFTCWKTYDSSQKSVSPHYSFDAALRKWEKSEADWKGNRMLQTTSLIAFICSLSLTSLLTGGLPRAGRLLSWTPTSTGPWGVANSRISPVLVGAAAGWSPSLLGLVMITIWWSSPKLMLPEFSRVSKSANRSSDVCPVISASDMALGRQGAPH